ncbi:hypothetical protein GCM10008910_35280 [Faecalicatena orotica]
MYSIDQKATSLDVFHQTNSVSKTEQEWVQMLPNYKARPKRFSSLADVNSRY